ncbi:MAG: cupin domain-containing protein [Dehalococcoidia bacterium]|nr:cupin domain-containing protein [Dehalococcoidia bacterium]
MEPISTALFRGEVARRVLVGNEQTGQLTVGLVRFEAGGRNVFHTHTFDQVLYVTEGEGIVASEDEEVVVGPGDVVVIPAGQKHWHGATQTNSMAHLAIGTPGETSIAE